MVALLESFSKAQNGNQEEMEKISRDFMPIIMKYARMLKYDDGKEDLTVFILEFVKNVDLTKFEVDAQLLAYLEISVYHKYIDLSTRDNKITKHEKLVSGDKIDQTLPDFSSVCDNNIFIKKCFNDTLSQKEVQVLYLHYIMGYAIVEIADIYGITRQAVNQTKNRAIVKLSNIFK